MKLTINVPLLPDTPAPYTFEVTNISESNNELHLDVVGWDNKVIKQLYDMTMHAVKFQHTVYRGTLEIGDTVYEGVFIKHYEYVFDENKMSCIFNFDYKYNSNVTGSVSEPFIVQEQLIVGSVP